MLRPILHTLIITGSLSLSAFSYADGPTLSLSVSQSGGSAQNDDGSPDATRPSESKSRILPIWGDEARARGYDLPEPFGVGYNYMNLRQDIVVDKIGFIMPTQPDLGGLLTIDGINIDAGHTREKSETHMLKLDSWVFPFMNVYGLYGKTKGKSHTTLAGGSVDIRDFLGNPHHLDLNSVIKGKPFDLDFEGKTYGAGVTFAGAYEQFFGTVDVNYTKTNLDILDGDIKALVVSPRVGYEFVFSPLIAGQGNTKLQVWTGAMYQDITQRFKGDISGLNLSLPGGMENMIPGDMKFDVEQHLAHKWSNLVGARLEVTRNFNIISEVGFNNRNSFFISGEFRF
ncbi:hypothetical protein ISO70_12845 [Morganella morganii subsp. morganii]|uniref:hypothetical protein n=1 Tax=Morganella morganii TaxID=582 RepID=UPI0011404FD7|nr:hypothetical protein [Morganella morganii]MBT0353529.1 hypothetical protein [Morganella morganii subsp. morganii]TPW56418.1 hypothetical protein DL503_09740 [Morganella morganii]HDS6400342.1 hypothetical protein [Morganella morganii subsp. morganii]